MFTCSFQCAAGSILEAMADAIERAWIVLVCMSDTYKQSASCRTGSKDQIYCKIITEAEYLYKLRKDFIPMRMQDKYNADGWLGALVGNKLYFDVSDMDKLRANMPALLKVHICLRVQ